MTKELRQLGLNVMHVLRVKIQNLLPRSAIQFSVVLNVLIKAGKIVESKLLRDGKHFGFGLVQLPETDLMNFIGTQISGRHSANRVAISSASIRKRPDTGIGPAMRRVIIVHKCGEFLVGGN